MKLPEHVEKTIRMALGAVIAIAPNGDEAARAREAIAWLDDPRITPTIARSAIAGELTHMRETMPRSAIELVPWRAVRWSTRALTVLSRRRFGTRDVGEVTTIGDVARVARAVGWWRARACGRKTNGEILDVLCTLGVVDCLEGAMTPATHEIARRAGGS